MGFAALFAFIEAVGKVISTVKSIVDFAKHAEDFFNGIDDWDRMRFFLTVRMTTHGEMLQIAGDILDAVAQLDRRIFLERIADKLGDSDQAVLAFDTWKRTGDANQKAVALNDSAGALADILRYSDNNVYPRESLVYPLIEILVIRLVILKEGDPDFVRSSIGRRPIEDSVSLLRSTADGLEIAIQQANVIQDDSAIGTRVKVRPPEEGGGRVTIQVLRLSISYRNVDRSVSFDKHGEFEPEDGDLNAILAQARADAAAARQRGVARDLEVARITELRETADIAERSLRVAEARWVTSKFLKREPTTIETSYFVARRQRASFEEVALTLEGYMSLDRESLGALATEVTDREIDPKAEESLWNVAQTFGNRAVLRLFLADGSSSDKP
jgi:hypothetical protein